MSTIFTTTIPETDCIGDSLDTINNNFDNLGTAITTVSSTVNAFNVADTPTVDLSFNTTTRTLSASIISGSVGTVQLSAGAVTPVKLSQPLTLATAQNATGTAINFTGIPSWVNRITVIFNGVASSGSSQHVVRLGTSEGVASTGYASWWGAMLNATAVFTTGSIEGFGIWNGSSVDIKSGHMFLTRISGNAWISSHAGGFTNNSGNFIITGGGTTNLAGTLDRIRITTLNGTDTFRLGNVNIMYEG